MNIEIIRKLEEVKWSVSKQITSLETLSYTANIKKESRKSQIIMAVDDDEKNLKLLEAFLKPYGYEVILIRSGPEVLDKTRSVIPDLILLDVMMPEMDGFELCRELKGSVTTAIVPIIMVTSLRGREEMLKGIKAGANDFLSKPVDKEDLIFRVKNALSIKALYNSLEINNREMELIQKQYKFTIENLRKSLGEIHNGLAFILKQFLGQNL